MCLIRVSHHAGIRFVRYTGPAADHASHVGPTRTVGSLAAPATGYTFPFGCVYIWLDPLFSPLPARVLSMKQIILSQSTASNL